MKNNNDLSQLHQQMMAQIDNEINAEMAENIAENQSETMQTQGLCGCDLESMKAAGLDTSKLAEIQQQLDADAEQEYIEMDQFMSQTSANSFADEALNPDANFLPEGATLLTPSWSKVYSDTLDNNPLVNSGDIDNQAVVSGGNCKNIWNWAKGGGWGCTGGRASNTQIATWAFWYKPNRSKFYSIRPRFEFNGFYIAKADDKWYNCKNAQVKVSAQTNVYQYNWKGLSSVDLVNINRNNVNLNKRLDDTRYTNYTALLGKDDWALVVCKVKLYVRAQGGGSYAKADFAAGANKVCVPHVIIS